ncbi:MAG: hypothetical protein ACXW1N_07720 [Halobacteriota archaeon]
MIHANAVSLPSIARPLPINQSMAVENVTQLYLPPFPEIDLNWDGFTISPLHWVSIKTPNRERRPFDEWQSQLAIQHERCHATLALTPFAVLLKSDMLQFYRLILTTFDEVQGAIQVPVLPDESGSTLQGQWDILLRVARRSSLVEEIFAVRSSSLWVVEHGFITPSRRRRFIKACKDAYDVDDHRFSVTHDAFAFIATSIGETAATAMIHSVFDTGHPSAAFLDIVFEMCKVNPGITNSFIWTLEDDPRSIAGLSYDQAYRGFSRLLDHLDRDDSRYLRRVMAEFEETTMKSWNVDTEEDEFLKFLYGYPTAVLFSEHSPSGNVRFPELVDRDATSIREVDYGNLLILLESIRQQITRGTGLLCPFWGESSSCCSSDNKEFLGKVWSYTSPDRSKCKRWERLGCLD